METKNQNTQVYCLTLDLKNDPELIALYEAYHRPDGIWPEIIAGIKSVGILKMDIYRASNRLVMILEADNDFDIQRDFARMNSLPRQQEWAALMAQFQQQLSFAKEGEHWVMMNKIFYLYDPNDQ
jgi:L-rhamnose mutarotase